MPRTEGVWRWLHDQAFGEIGCTFSQNSGHSLVRQMALVLLVRARAAHLPILASCSRAVSPINESFPKLPRSPDSNFRGLRNITNILRIAECLKVIPKDLVKQICNVRLAGKCNANAGPMVIYTWGEFGQTACWEL